MMGLVTGLPAFAAKPAHSSSGGQGGQGNPPSVECASSDPLWNDEYWKIQMSNGLGSIDSGSVSGAISLDADGDWINNNSSAVFRIVLKVGQGVGVDSILSGFWTTGQGGTINLGTLGLSHVTFCFTDAQVTTTTTQPEQEETTTTTQAEQTTTTTQAEQTTTTTQAEQTTTTTQAEQTTTTTQAEQTTSTTQVRDETPSATVPTTQVSESIPFDSVPAEAQVLGIQIEAATTAAAATVAAVAPVTLPFTGIETGTMASLAMSIFGAGMLLLAASRKREVEQA
jgi:hypothetical protein